MAQGKDDLDTAHALAADSYVIGGELDGERLVTVDEVTVDEVTVDGTTFYAPRTAPAIAAFATTASAELEANRLRPMLAQGLDHRGGAVPCQWDEDLVFRYDSQVGTTVRTAASGFEEFANHHLARGLAPEEDDPAPMWRGKDAYHYDTPEKLRTILPAVLHVAPPTNEPWWPDVIRINTLAAEHRHPKPNKVITGSGLDGERTLRQRMFNGEYQGASRAMACAFEYFSPGYIPERKRRELPEPPGGWPD